MSDRGADGDLGRGIDEGDVVDAGPFGVWAAATAVVIRTGGTAEVPCGTCTACCTSAQFVHVAPDEVDALAHIPKALRFPAPGFPRGHVLLPYDARGHCPMLVDGACSIYDHRPRTCRTYDCRVFPATGVVLDAGDKPAIAARAARWRFAFPTDDDQARRDAVQAALGALRAARAAGDDTVPRQPTQLAAAAVEHHEAHLAPGHAPPRDCAS
jgi:uncharacterized protein